MSGFASNDIAEIGRRMRIDDRENVIPANMGQAAGYTREELKNVFDCLCDHDDWKRPIRASIHANLLPTALVAVEFFTATKAKIEGSDKNGRFIIVADGYRAGPAGDH